MPPANTDFAEDQHDTLVEETSIATHDGGGTAEVTHVDAFGMPTTACHWRTRDSSCGLSSAMGGS